MKFNCPHCHTLIEADDSYLNEVIHCPSCEQHLKLESQEESGRLSITTEIASSWQELSSSGRAVTNAVSPEGRTIRAFLRERNITGGVEVDEGDDSTGTTFSRYTLGGVVGEGGMGKILEVRDNNVRRRVAMKILHDPEESSNEDIARFVEEAQITGQLDHPSIVPVYELGVDTHGQVYYTMKYLSDTTLKDILADIRIGNRTRIKEYPLSRLLAIFQRVCEGVMFAHSKHIVHRDIKPENILVGDFGEVLILDWGLAKILSQMGPAAQRLRQQSTSEAIGSARNDLGAAVDGMQTIDGEVVGTPRYMSPEQADGRIDEVDTYSDIFSLGAMLYEILTLNPPVGGGDATAVLEKVTDGFIIPFDIFNSEHSPSKRKKLESQYGITLAPLLHCPNGHAPEALGAVAMKAMSYERVGRYSTVRRLTREIISYESGHATSAERASAFKQTSLFFARNKAIAISAIATFVMLIIGIFLLVSERSRLTTALAGSGKQTTELQAALSQASTLRSKLSTEGTDKATLLIQTENYSLAARTAENACKADPANGLAWYVRGRAELAQLHLQDSQSAFLSGVQNSEASGSVSQQCGRLSAMIKSIFDHPDFTGTPTPDMILALAAQIRSSGDEIIANAVEKRARPTF